MADFQETKAMCLFVGGAASASWKQNVRLSSNGANDCYEK